MTAPRLSQDSVLCMAASLVDGLARSEAALPWTTADVRNTFDDVGKGVFLLAGGVKLPPGETVISQTELINAGRDAVGAHLRICRRHPELADAWLR